MRPKGPRPIASTRIPWEVHRTALDLAAERGITRAELYRQILLEALQEKKCES